ncbi:protein dissatisfaction [Schistocerca piceifrons]|uniref:protein dissatisfaction n=1 Tax=Schistocerca piceifrons TaxID=274613 RepID=UPI001F5F995F|nr:protein dissatisfaction [Schistocerca piceifrons]
METLEWRGEADPQQSGGGCVACCELTAWAAPGWQPQPAPPTARRAVTHGPGRSRRVSRGQRAEGRRGFRTSPRPGSLCRGGDAGHSRCASPPHVICHTTSALVTTFCFKDRGVGSVQHERGPRKPKHPPPHGHGHGHGAGGGPPAVGAVGAGPAPLVKELPPLLLPAGPAAALALSPTWEVLQETTARLLFMAVRWVRCLAPFQTLSKRDQLLLLQESWKELFLLHLAQWSIPWDLSALFGCSKARDRLPQDDAATNIEIKTIQEIMGRFRQLSPDGSECGCMKAVVLFTPETAGLCDVQPVEMLQDQAQCILGDYVRSRYPRQPTRFGRLLLLLPSLRAVRQSTVERLFFKDTIGDIPIQRLLGDMYHMDKYT